MNKTLLVIPSLLSIALLQACGGGGDHDSHVPAFPPTNDHVSTGLIVEQFVAGNAPRYQLIASDTSSFGNLGPVVQRSDGAMMSLGGNSISGNAVVKEMTGDSTFAMGRWFVGTVTRSSGTETLAGTNDRSHHYVVVNEPKAFPASGSMDCDSGFFTAPTSTKPGDPVGTGTARGSVHLSFGPGGATVSGAISVQVPAVAAFDVPLAGTAATPADRIASGTFLDGDSGSVIQIGEASKGAHAVAVSYAARLANGTRYLGVARFRCGA